MQMNASKSNEIVFANHAFDVELFEPEIGRQKLILIFSLQMIP